MASTQRREEDQRNGLLELGVQTLPHPDHRAVSPRREALRQAAVGHYAHHSAVMKYAASLDIEDDALVVPLGAAVPVERVEAGLVTPLEAVRRGGDVHRDGAVLQLAAL